MNLKTSFLFIIDSILITGQRQYFEKGDYVWNSMWKFIALFVGHCIGLYLIFIVSYAIIKGFEKFFLGIKDDDKGLKPETAMFYFSILILVVIVSLIIISHWMVVDDDHYDFF